MNSSLHSSSLSMGSVVLATSALAAACGTGGSGRAGGPPAMPVEVVTLAERAIEETTEYVGLVKSRQSTAVQPQVEGLVTRIRVRSGVRVAPEAPLLEIDARRQEALVASLESQLAARRADLQQARQESERMKTLVEAGATSQAEAEQTETALATAEAQVQATEAQLREQRVELGYYVVSAPTAGVVGDIPVRVGDRVTPSTVLTTIDQNRGLELYLRVPVPEASRLEVGLPVHLVDDAGQVFATEKLSFVSPSVDGATQSVLVKAILERTEGLRTEQFVRARIVWSQEPTLTVPIVALNRLGGQHFAFVAEDSDGGTVARQRSVELGPIVGNDYLLKSGLEAGERLIVSGIQRVRDGAPVSIVTGSEGSRAEDR
ncbi:MAG: efflux RND transporter periplasmic adaptor subunit [Acidobacteriota bacterium]